MRLDLKGSGFLFDHFADKNKVQSPAKKGHPNYDEGWAFECIAGVDLPGRCSGIHSVRFADQTERGPQTGRSTARKIVLSLFHVE